MARPLPDATSGKLERLLGLIDAYEAQLERDLQLHYRLDLQTEFVERRWTKLLNLIDNMPRPSLYLEARATDPEIAEALLYEIERNPSLESSPGERFAEWDPLMYLVAHLIDAVQHNTGVTIGTATGKVPELRPVPRPRSALELARDARRRQASRDLVSRLLPKTNE